jgi:poly-gamma-glutamate capsule biosynthesis protein CapA/YwtB (metallophosphatase superfamily)
MSGQQEVTIALAGDVMLGRFVNRTLERTGPAHPWGGLLLPLLHAADLVLCNLECALTSRWERWHDDGRYKAFYFRSEPDHVRSLSAAGVDLAVLANNHVLDFGVEGMRETVRVLDEAGISHVGAGEDEREARACARLRAGELRVAVVAFADHPAEWAAGPATPGISFAPIAASSLGVVADAIASARRDADLVVASFHWGPNMRARPSAAFRDFARSVVDAGADVFWGHSAHVVQGVELRVGRLVCYDTGDFLDDYAIDEDLRNDLSALFLVRVVDGRIARLDLVPVRIDHMRVDLASGDDRSRFASAFAAYSAEFGTKVVLGPERLTIAVDPA